MMIRQAVLNDAEAIAKVHIKCWITTYKNIVDDQYLSSLKWENRLSHWKEILQKNDESATFVALIEDQIVGFISGGKNRHSETHYDSELFAIYVLEQFQGLGIGTNLIKHLFKHLSQAHLKSMIVWVAENNPYKKFYETLGAEQTTLTKQYKVGNTELTIIAYGWNQIEGL